MAIRLTRRLTVDCPFIKEKVKNILFVGLVGLFSFLVYFHYLLMFLIVFALFVFPVVSSGFRWLPVASD